MAKDKNKKEQPIAYFNKEEREFIWDDLYIKEEGIVLEFDFDSKTGKIKSVKDDITYDIDSRELVRTKIELRPALPLSSLDLISLPKPCLNLSIAFGKEYS